MSIQPPGVDTTPIRNAYDEISTKVNNLNKQVRNYSFKTILKIALLVSFCFPIGFGIGYGVMSIAMSVFPLVPMVPKVITSFLITIGSFWVIGDKIDVIFNSAMKKSQTDFLFKINNELKKAYKDNSNDLNLALFSREYIFGGKCFTLPPAYLPFYEFKADKLELDSYETVEKRYIDIQQEESRRLDEIRMQEEQNSGLLSFLFPFRREKVSA
ncbi:MAG: hypothetical protein K1060chlam3_00084 [Candidatus Anoxychlamydiales bacterium]|nr:hypothetical protein [Candidatus Anoxychlamydiales bacterium]